MYRPNAPRIARAAPIPKIGIKLTMVVCIDMTPADAEADSMAAKIGNATTMMTTPITRLKSPVTLPIEYTSQKLDQRLVRTLKES